MDRIYIPSVREVLDNSAEKYGDSAFLKYVENGQIIEKSFIKVREDTLAFCRFLRSFSNKKKHIALIGKTTYEYLIFATAVLISGDVFVPFAKPLYRPYRAS